MLGKAEVKLTRLSEKTPHEAKVAFEEGDVTFNVSIQRAVKKDRSSLPYKQGDRSSSLAFDSRTSRLTDPTKARP